MNCLKSCWKAVYFNIAVRGEWTCRLCRGSDWIPWSSFFKKQQQNTCVINNSKTMNRLPLMTCKWDHLQEDELLPRSCSPQLACLPAAHTNPQGGTAVFPGQSYSHRYFSHLKKAGWDFSVFARKIAEGLPRNPWMCYKFVKLISPSLELLCLLALT